MKSKPISRRTALRYLAAGTVSSMIPRIVHAQSSSRPRALLGLDGHSMRGMKWKALQHIEYAATLKLDAVLMNGLQYFESLDASHLKRVKALADSNGIRLYIGVGSISKGSNTFKGAYGNPEATLIEGIRVATELGSKTVNIRIGNFPDRFTEGGIEARMAEVIETINAAKTRAQDAGIRFAFENHAGDTRSEEILAMINTVGSDICGVMLDPGNAVWALEDPMQQLQKLGSHVLCMSVRDYMVWHSEEGATFQWTAIGEGLMDVPAYTRLLREKCPDVPIFIETISNSARPIPYLTSAFWDAYPKLRAADIKDFLALCRRGHSLELISPPAGSDAKKFDQTLQQNEFERSIRYLRNLS